MFDLDVFIIQPNFIIKSVATKLDVFVVSLFLKLLSTIEVFLVNGY